MIHERLIERLKSDEGFRHAPYQDHLGVWTIGYGTTYIVDHLGHTIKVNVGWNSISKTQGLKYLYANLVDAIATAKKFCQSFKTLNHIQQEALVNMCYQLGYRVFKFKKLRSALAHKSWQVAHDECIDSLWHTQTPKRCERVATEFLI